MPIVRPPKALHSGAAQAFAAETPGKHVRAPRAFSFSNKEMSSMSLSGEGADRQLARGWGVGGGAAGPDPLSDRPWVRFAREPDLRPISDRSESMIGACAR